MVEKLGKELEISKEKIMKSKNVGEFKEQVEGATAVREEQGLRRQAASRVGVEVHEQLDERIGSKGCIHELLGVETQLKHDLGREILTYRNVVDD